MTSESILWNVAGWIVVVFIGLAGVIVLWKMLTSKAPDLATLLSETTADGNNRIDKASLSRFQFLIFTFVISTGLLYVIFQNKGFPEIPNSVYILLGISGGSYVVSKGIQQSQGSTQPAQPPAQQPPGPTAGRPPAHGAVP